MEMEALMPRQPGADFGMLVGGVIVNDQMHVLLSPGLAVDRIEKADELLMPVAAHALTDDLAVEDIEGGEQGRGAVALVVMGHVRLKRTVPQQFQHLRFREKPDDPERPPTEAHRGEPPVSSVLSATRAPTPPPADVIDQDGDSEMGRDGWAERADLNRCILCSRRRTT